MAQTYDKFVMIPHLEYQELLRKSKELNQCTSTASEVDTTPALTSSPKPPGVAESDTSLTNIPQTNESRIENRDSSSNTSAHTDWKSQWYQL